MTWSLRNTNPKDTNAWDLYEGEVLVAKLPWGGKPYGERIVRAMNAQQDLVNTLDAIAERDDMCCPCCDGTATVGHSDGCTYQQDDEDGFYVIGAGWQNVIEAREAIAKAKP